PVEHRSWPPTRCALRRRSPVEPTENPRDLAGRKARRGDGDVREPLSADVKDDLLGTLACLGTGHEYTQARLVNVRGNHPCKRAPDFGVDASREQPPVPCADREVLAF